MDNSQRDQVFRPDQSKFWMRLVAGLFLLVLGILFLLIPILIAAAQRGGCIVVMGISGAVLAILGVWVLFVARRTAAAVVRIGDEGLTLKLQSWSLWKPKMLRAARLRWDEILNVRLCEIDNFLVPGGIDENFILSTTQGQFVVQTTLWGSRARQIAESVAGRSGRPIHSPGDAPAEAESRLSPSERFGVGLVRGFGWLCTIVGWLCMALLLLATFAAKPADRYSLGTAVLTCGFVVYGARSIRQFEVRIG